MRYPITLRPVDTVRSRTRFVVRDAESQAVASLEHDAADDVIGVVSRRQPRLRIFRGAEFKSPHFEIVWSERDDTSTEFFDADGRFVGGIDALATKRDEPSRSLACRRAGGDVVLLLHNLRAHTHRLLRWVSAGYNRQSSALMGSWDLAGLGAYVLGKSDFLTTRPDGAAVMSGEGRLLSMAGVTIRLHAELDEQEHELALLAAFSQAFLIAR